MAESLLGLLYFAALLCLSCGIGAGILRRFDLGTVARAELFLFGVPLGLGVVAYVVFALGLLHLFHTPVFVGILALSVPALFLVVPLLRQAAGRRQPGDRFTLACGVVLAFIALCTLVAALAPPVSLEWDSLSYHLAGPKTYLREGRIFYIPYDHHTNFPFTVEMLYTLLLGVGSVGGAKLCHWLYGVLLVVSVAAFAARHIGGEGDRRHLGVIAAVLVATTPMAIWEATTAYIDLATALYVWLALYALMNAAQAAGIGVKAPVTVTAGRASLDWLIVSALMMGFALGTKFTVVAFWGLMLIGICGAHYAATRRWARETIPHAALWGGISLLVASPWYIKTALYTGNPVYPFFYSIFGGRYWNAENAAEYTAAQSVLGMPKTPVNFLLSPWLVTMPPDAARFTEYAIFSLSPIFLACLLALPLSGRRLSRAGAVAGMFGVGVFLFWFLSVQQTRYLLPALPAFAIVCAEVQSGLMGQRRLRAVATVLLAATALWGVYIAGGLAFWGLRGWTPAPAWQVVSGATSRPAYVERGLRGDGAADLWINQNTPAEAKVALFDTTFGFYLDRPYVWAQPDHAAGLIPWEGYRDVDDWLADFKRRGYTTLVVGAPLTVTDAPPDNRRWRSLLAEAIQSDKVVPVFEQPARSVMTKDGPVTLSVKVYRIP